MAFPLDKKAGTTSAEAQYRSVLSHFPDDLAEKIDLQRMFVLVDGILPFEACLYYQVLPLCLDGNCLLLGMVHPEDSPAADYVRRIIAYHNYYPQPQPISSTALQAALSAYLHYTGSRSAQPPVNPALARAAEPSSSPQEDDRNALEAEAARAQRASERASARARAEQKLSRNLQATLVVDSPEDLSQELAPPRFRPIYQPADGPPNAPPNTPLNAPPDAPVPGISQAAGRSPSEAEPRPDLSPSPDADSLDGDSLIEPVSHASYLGEPTPATIDEPDELQDFPAATSQVNSAHVDDLDHSPDHLQPAAIPRGEERAVPGVESEFEGDTAQVLPGDAAPVEALPPVPELAPDIPLETLQDYLATFIHVEQPPQVPTPLMKPIPSLAVQLNHLSRPAETLATLPPNELLQELLGRVLVGGIGRLYFEHQLRYGRILWSQNGVLQSVIDRLNLRHFRGVIAELKHLANLPLVPVEQPRQVEIERLYDRTRLLLRFRFIPTEHGEEATLQILRGAALKFYQQQQISTLERDALRIARQLQTKLSEIRDRARLESGMMSAKLEVLPALSQIIKTIEEQVDSLQPEDADTSE